MCRIWLIICNAGDGSNFLLWLNQYSLVLEAEVLAQNNEETFASGDGLQLTELKFSSSEALDEFVKLNGIRFVEQFCE